MTPTRQRLAILGSTGSIGTSTLDVVAAHPDRFEVIGLTSHLRVELLAEQCRRFNPLVAVLPTEERAVQLRALLSGSALRTEVRVGAAALCELAAAPEVDSVMAAIVGAAGLPPAWPRQGPANACCRPTRKPWWWAAHCSCRPWLKGVPRCFHRQ